MVNLGADLKMPKTYSYNLLLTSLNFPATQSRINSRSSFKNQIKAAENMFKEVLATCVSQKDVLKLRLLKRKTDSLIHIEFLPKEYSDVVDSWATVVGLVPDVEASIAKLKDHMDDSFIRGEAKKMI